MGYTHYWVHQVIPADKFAAFVQDVRKIVAAAGVPLAGWDGTGEPEITDEVISLNGVHGSDDDPQDGETFHLSPSATSFEFCKTGRQPYDLVVTTILLHAGTVLPHFGVNSDGDWDNEEEWGPARELYFNVFGAPPKNVLTGDMREVL